MFVLSYCEERDAAFDVAWAAYARKANQVLRGEHDPRTWRKVPSAIVSSASRH